MGLISENLNDKLNMLIGKAFSINRMLDRGMSLLMVRWKMINTSTILHENVAHAYPGKLFADGISDYQGVRDMETMYPATPQGGRDYDSPLSFFEDYLAENIEFEDMIKDTIDLAVEEGDRATKDVLDKTLVNLVPYTALSMDLVDLVKACDNDKFKLIMLDAQIEKYIHIDLKED